MSDLFWPGDERAGDLLSAPAWLDAMVAVEQAWLDALVAAGIAPESAVLTGLVGNDDLDGLARGAEGGGNPVLGLVALLRTRSGNEWVHRGLTSQDVVDSGLMLCLRDATQTVRQELRTQISSLAALADHHRASLMAGRTLTQHAVPVTFGLKAAGWLGGLLDAAEAVDRLVHPAQLGGAAGTLAATVELGGAGTDPAAALAVAADAARRLELAPASPWHTTRSPAVAIGDALVACTDAWGRVATDVVTLSRPEIGELAEPGGAGRGGSSTMPHKQNPVLSVLLRRAALTTPQLAATLHLAAALADDERPTGAWHTEWPTLQALGRRTLAAASQATELLAGLQVDTEQMAATARADWSALSAERDAIARFAGTSPTDGDYLGAASPLVDAALARARTYLQSLESPS